MDQEFKVLENIAHVAAMRQKVIASNIANADTPNYKAFEMVVAEEMQRNQESGPKIPFARTNPNHLPRLHESTDLVTLKAAKAPDFSLRGDGNTVDIERTMGNLAKNTLLYNTAVQLISKKFSRLKNVIKGGGN